MPTHVREQIVDASCVVVKAAAPALVGVYSEGSLDWDRRSYPIGVGAVTSGTCDLVGDNGIHQRRLQRRRFKIRLEIHAEEILDIVTELNAFVVLVEGAMIPANFPLPVEDIEFVGDSGIMDFAKGEKGIISAIGLEFLVTAYTFEGDPTHLVDPNNPDTTVPPVGGMFDD